MCKVKNMIDQKFGRLTVIERRGSNKRGDALWLCKCDCGNEIIVKGSNLRNGTTKSCGCLHKEKASELTYKNIIGQKFCRLTVIEEKGKNKHGSYMWLCQCDCGNKIIIDGASLRSGHTKSCGCLQKEVLSVKRKELNEEMWQDEEFRQKQSEKMSNKNYENWQNEEYQNKMSEQTKKLWDDENFRELCSGKNHYRYNHNLTDENREDRRIQEGYNEWKQEVKKQANFTCNICGNRGNKLRSHHLDGYNWCKERRLDLTNGVCLCESCHKEFHHIYGYGDNTEADYLEYKFNYKMN